MSQNELLKAVKSQWKSNLPFVGYSKPNETILNVILQNSDELYCTSDFIESGFVFSPFDHNEDTILFPSEHCKFFKADFESEVIEERLNNHPVFNQPNSASAKKKHLELVQKAIDEIADNSFKKVVISREELIPISEENPIALFKNLMQLYPSAMVYIWFHPKVGLWLGATPETLLHVEGLKFNTMALAGTQIQKESNDVIWDAKNLMEQLLVTNFIKDQLEPISAQITISEPETLQAGRLLHLKSNISGVLKSEGNNLKQVLRSLHPTPAVCGLPKAEAKEFILENENYHREFYSGFLGELNLSKTRARNNNKRNVENNAYTSIKKVSHFYVNLRCMQLKSKTAHLYVGGGITIASDPLAEWEETVNKLQTMNRILG